MKIIVFLLFFCVLSSIETQVYAQEDGYIAVDGNQIDTERLNDDVIEYDELGSLIYYNNTAIQLFNDQTSRTRQDYTYIKDELITERRDARNDRDDAEDEGDMAAYIENSSYVKLYSSAISDYSDMLDDLDKPSKNKTRIRLERRLTKGSQNLMISYQSLQKQREILQKMEQLYEQLYEETEAAQKAGIATMVEVEQAFDNWNQAKLTLDSMINSEDSIYSNLCIMVGVPFNEEIKIGEIPPFQTEILEQMNLEEDTKTAISNNTDIIDRRHEEAVGSSAVKQKQLKLNELEENVKTEMQKLYSEVEQAKISYEAAKIGYESATLSWNQAQKSQELGLLGKSQYLQAELSYLEKKSAFEASDLELRQAYETYKWAVKGIIGQSQ